MRVCVCVCVCVCAQFKRICEMDMLDPSELMANPMKVSPACVLPCITHFLMLYRVVWTSTRCAQGPDFAYALGSFDW